MTKSRTTAPQVRPRQSLSARLWLLATLAVLLSEIVVFLPYIAHERSDWLTDRVEDASLAARGLGGPLDAAKRDELLRLSGVVAIHFSHRARGFHSRRRRRGDRGGVRFAPDKPVRGYQQRAGAMVRTRDRMIKVVANSPFSPSLRVEVVVSRTGDGRCVATVRARVCRAFIAGCRRHRRTGLSGGALVAGPTHAPDDRQHRRVPGRSGAHRAARPE